MRDPNDENRIYWFMLSLCLLVCSFAAALSIRTAAKDLRWKYNCLTDEFVFAQNAANALPDTSGVPTVNFEYLDILAKLPVFFNETDGLAEKHANMKILADSGNEEIDAAIAAYEKVQQQKEIEARLARIQSTIPAGAYGRLWIPSVGIDVGLYFIDATAGAASLQAVVDAEDSAAFIVNSPWAVYLIAEHRHQKFMMLPSVSRGTAAYIVRPDAILKLSCTGTEYGYNYGYLVHGDGTELANAAPYCLYTCTNVGRGVFISYWNS